MTTGSDTFDTKQILLPRDSAPGQAPQPDAASIPNQQADDDLTGTRRAMSVREMAPGRPYARNVVSRSRTAVYARRRKRRMARVEHDLTEAQWMALKAAWDGCAYCHAADAHLQKDCALPISVGGRYTLTNVVPACRSCNASKCNTEVTAWLRRKKLDEGAFLVRQAEILRVLVTFEATGDQR
jgi:5-methylcytosine-specific restriction endonuclease McrA